MDNCWLCCWYTWLGNHYGCGLGGCRNFEMFKPSRNGNVYEVATVKDVGSKDSGDVKDG